MADVKLLRQYHAICNQLGMSSSDKEALLDSWGVQSSKQLTDNQLRSIIAKLRPGMHQSVHAEADRWRKRCIAAIGEWLAKRCAELSNPVENMLYIKKIACRASGEYDNFNQIPVSVLMRIYNEFINKNKVSETISMLTKELANKQLINN